jgi:hypothetical protein
MLFQFQRAYSQVLHTENFNVILDTSKVFKGNFVPSFRFRNVKEDFIEIENTADISLRIKNHGFTVANKIEYSIFGKESLMSGGFIYLEYMNLQSKKIAFEPFYQMHWQEIRGLKLKHAGGANFRWRAVVNKNTGLFIGVGSLYEFEKWVYTGVPDNLLPPNPLPIEVQRFRGNTYISFKQKLGSSFDFDASVYYQPTYSNPFTNYRLAGSFELTYNVNKYLGIRYLYQNIYDSSPLVPITKMFHDVNFGVTLSF